MHCFRGHLVSKVLWNVSRRFCFGASLHVQMADGEYSVKAGFALWSELRDVMTARAKPYSDQGCTGSIDVIAMAAGGGVASFCHNSDHPNIAWRNWM